MTAPITKSQLTFALPNLSYVNARWEEPNLTQPERVAPRHGVGAWIARRVTAFLSWNATQRQSAELSRMTDRELLDIGLNRGDVSRVFLAEHGRDLLRARALLG